VPLGGRWKAGFKPRAAAEEGIVDRNVVRWYERNVGYASSAQADNAFGVTNDLNLACAEPSGEGTIVTWEEYYEAADLPMMRGECSTNSCIASGRAAPPSESLG
jgi:hypothetical protein